MQKILDLGTAELELNWPEVPDAIQQRAITLWEEHKALIPGTDPIERAKQVVALARDKETGQTLGVATIQQEYMDWVDQEMFRYRTFAVADARLRSISVQMVNDTYDFLQSIPGQAVAGLYMEIENRFLMQHQNEGIWFECRCSYIGSTPEGWHKRVRFFPDACLSVDDLQ
jgi:hypothetical protein